MKRSKDTHERSHPLLHGVSVRLLLEAAVGRSVIGKDSLDGATWKQRRAEVKRLVRDLGVGQGQQSQTGYRGDIYRVARQCGCSNASERKTTYMASSQRCAASIGRNENLVYA